MVTVKVVEVDKMGRINLSMKPGDLVAKTEEVKEEENK
jgi:polyribonucleotide nucleotidyltransferase